MTSPSKLCLGKLADGLRRLWARRQKPLPGADRARWNPSLLRDLGLSSGDLMAISAGLYAEDASRRRR